MIPLEWTKLPSQSEVFIDSNLIDPNSLSLMVSLKRATTNSFGRELRELALD
jgi:hypothetical protein